MPVSKLVWVSIFASFQAAAGYSGVDPAFSYAYQHSPTYCTYTQVCLL